MVLQNLILTTCNNAPSLIITLYFSLSTSTKKKLLLKLSNKGSGVIFLLNYMYLYTFQVLRELSYTNVYIVASLFLFLSFCSYWPFKDPLYLVFICTVCD